MILNSRPLRVIACRGSSWDAGANYLFLYAHTRSLKTLGGEERNIEVGWRVFLAWQLFNTCY